ncbi:hypothetical protein QQP08_003953 [Theobroma cacao]|nr:hypothetical protein QQP08_003953 [Theobroma cacao]
MNFNDTRLSRGSMCSSDGPGGGVQGRKSRKRGSFKACCHCPCVRVTASAFRGLGRCLFVSCYPVMQCFGWDDCRHHHHHHRHFH